MKIQEQRINSLKSSTNMGDDTIPITINSRVNADVLKWATEFSRLPLDVLCSKLGISEKEYDRWIKGHSYPTYSQVESFADIIKKPIAVFFLESPPSIPLPMDRRAFPLYQTEYSYEAMQIFYKAKHMQDNARELLEELNIDSNITLPIYSLSDSAVKVAKKYRSEFGITESKQTKWHNGYDAYKYMKEKIEEKNIFIFSLPLPLEDARAFIYLNEEPASIVVSTKDIIVARIFSLIHEFAHALLRDESVSTPSSDIFYRYDDPIEIWCNEFASELLMPQSLLLELYDTYFLDKSYSEYYTILKRLSYRYCVSKSMLLYRLFLARLIPSENYHEIKEQIEEDQFEPPPGGDYYKKIISNYGTKYIQLVRDNYGAGNINEFQAAEYMSINIYNVNKLWDSV